MDCSSPQDSVATLVSTRCSGCSYLNRVELQNGCLALAHANLFIPSTLKGTCLNSDTGEIDQDKLKENLEAAIDVYMERCNKAPCGNAQIFLYTGADSTNLQLKRKELATFLMERCNKAPCGNAQIFLYTGADSTNLQLKRKELATFLKGSNKMKMKLKSLEPELYEEFDKVWSDTW